MNCHEVHERIDDFMTRMLPESDAVAIDEHLENCPECSAFLSNRVALRARVRQAVRDVEAPPDLGHRIQFEIARAGAPRKFIVGGFGKTMIALAAALIVTAGAFYFRPSSDSGSSRESQSEFIARLTSEVPPIMRVGLQQHIHCGVLREYSPNAPSLADLARTKEVSPALIDALETHAPSGLHVVMAHRCTYQGRPYMHVVARGQGHLMSLLITKSGEGETVAGEFNALAHSGPTIYTVDAFESQGFLVFLVSDAPADENAKTLKAMSPQVKAALL